VQESNRKKLELACLCILPVALGLFYFFSHPFKETLASRTIDLDRYSSAQRINFVTAAHSLDGAIIKPGATFSFNNRVGSRAQNGFVAAPSYINGHLQNTAGGGICLVSSTLYQVALLSGLAVVERTPHTSTVASVQPGLDATVWYGRTDLRLKNTYDQPVAISCREAGDNLEIAVVGDTFTKVALASHPRSFDRREYGAGDGKTLLVEVFLKDGQKERLLSRDHYRLSR
jgi:vancomycin resistance protein VanW